MKKTLLIAAAALAAGVISQNAQGAVYSQNVVGYANVVMASSAYNYCVSIPFKSGVSNGANEVFGNLPDYSSVLVWVPEASGFKSYTKDAVDYPNTGWADETGEVPPPILPVGQAVFVTPGSDNTTATFVGTIAVNVGASNVMVFPSSAYNYCVGSPVPYAGSVTNGNNSGGGLNMNSLPDYSSILIWVPELSGFKSYTKDAVDYPNTGWADESGEAVPPTLSVGQGVFLTPGTDGGTWTVGL